MKNKILTIVLLGIFLISFVNAEVNNYSPVKIGECKTALQSCTSCTYVNISISYPNSTLAIINQGMSDEGGGTWSYEFCNTSQKGRYDVMGSGDLKGTDTSFDVLYFEASATGKELTQAKTNSYIIILIISILVFIGTLFVGIKLPSKNKSDEMTGYIIAVSNLKYLKQTIMGLSYLILVWISYFIWMITEAFLDFGFLASILKFIFYLLAWGTLPFFVLYVYFVIANFVKDKDIADLLLRGITVK